MRRDMLQWGHAFVSVETTDTLDYDTARRMLQWGHAFVSVETGARRTAPGRTRRRFNGATLL